MNSYVIVNEEGIARTELAYFNALGAGLYDTFPTYKEKNE